MSDSVDRIKRKDVAEDRIREPYQLPADKVVALSIAYWLFVTGFGICTLYVLIQEPALFLCTAVLSFVQGQILFLLVHFWVHTSFLEYREDSMACIAHYAFVHHYRDPQILYRNWLAHRLMYFFYPDNFTKGSATYYTLFFCVVAGGLSIYKPILGLAYIVGHFWMQFSQGIVHEWYHVPRKKRKSHYIFLSYWLLSFFEKIRLISTKNHLLHHRHGVNTLDKVQGWTDLYLPFGDALGDLLWKRAISRYERGKKNASTFGYYASASIGALTVSVVLAGFILAGHLLL